MKQEADAEHARFVREISSEADRAFQDKAFADEERLTALRAQQNAANERDLLR